LKFSGDLGLGEILGRNLLRLVKELGWQLDLVTAVPISSQKKAKRGYNQSALLAWPVALGLAIPFRPAAIQRQRATRSQIGLDFAGRWDNVQGAFKANPAFVQGKCILIVDDVFTSGATLFECSSAILKAGASQVYGLTLSRATLAQHSQASSPEHLPNANLLDGSSPRQG
jgi:ComF family protein